MTRVRYTPHEENLKAIKRFLKTVSWGSECILCTCLDGSAAYLLNEHYILVPCTWEEYNATKEVAVKRALFHGVKPGVIITNEADKQNCERIWWDVNRNSIVIYWLSIENWLDANRLTMKALEGLDWQKSLIAVAKEGVDAKPVWEWESPS